MMTRKELLGEFIGTAILVFIGCGSVAVTVLFGTFTSLFQVALVWGLGVALAIYCTKKWSHSHLNPAVSLAMAVVGGLPYRKLPTYFIAQTLGAVSGAVFMYLLLSSSFEEFELSNQIIRGSKESMLTAQCFGEFFPNPGYRETISITWFFAMLWEMVGTILLVASIFFISHFHNFFGKFAPLFIGFSVTGIICLVAPYTQAGLNPARDFGPRMVAYFAGWNSAAFPDPSMSFFTVYLLGPLVGGAFTSIVFKLTKRYF